MRNSLPGEKNPIFERYRKEKGMREFNKLIYYLKVKGYIKVKNLENKRGIILTKDGINRAIKASFKLDKKRRSDGKWVMLIFDIPEKYRRSRSILRGALRSLGYKIYQQSVWISPYDVSERTEQFLQSHDLEKYVRIFLIEEI
jgi:DNA-binding transcriptional regulator PaaX